MSPHAHDRIGDLLCLHFLVFLTWWITPGGFVGQIKQVLSSQLHFLSTTTVNGKPDKTVTSYCRHRWISPMRPTWRFPSTNTSSKLQFLPTTTIKRKLNKTVPSCCSIHLFFIWLSIFIISSYVSVFVLICFDLVGHVIRVLLAVAVSVELYIIVCVYIY